MGRIFKDMKEAINEIERDIYEMGISVHPHTMQNKIVKGDDRFSTMEVQNYSFSILDTYDKDACLLDGHLEWCLAEFLERISKNFTNPGEAWKIRSGLWQEFLNAEGEMDYTYNDRINGFDQLKNVIKELKINPDSRQCIIHVHWPADTEYMQKARIPCSMYYQLMVRRGKLDIIYNMRSSDFNTHFRNDIWLAAELRNYIADTIDIEPGLFHMNVGSLHIYKGYSEDKHVF